MIDFKNGALFKLKRDKNAKVGQVEDLLINGETVIGSYTAVRDYVVFTNKRIIAVNVQGITGKKQDYSSLPYSKVQAFSVETSGVIDLDSEVERYFSALGKAKFESTGDSNVKAISQASAAYALK